MSKRYRPNVWYQVGGDMNPADHGGTIAREDSHGNVEVLQIQPVVAYVGEGEACEVGFPFWTKEACYDRAELAQRLRMLRAQEVDKDVYDGVDVSKRGSRLWLAGELCEAGHHTDEGPSGFSRDIFGGRRVSWWSKGGFGGHQADAEFRRMMKERGK